MPKLYQNDSNLLSMYTDMFKKPSVRLIKIWKSDGDINNRGTAELGSGLRV